MKYDWKEAGEEWSASWGSSSAQWFGSILPRIHDCLPTRTILEIAPGFGRWTHYLKDYCEELSIVDRSSECIEACLREFGNKLKIGGKGFIHHSNFGEYGNSLRERLPEALAKPLIKAKILDWAHHRNPSMSADLFRALCEQNGLHCVTQELVNWRGRRLIDCLSFFVRSDSGGQKPTKVIRNPNFMREAARIRRQWRAQA